jgi:hypothetical protein
MRSKILFFAGLSAAATGLFTPPLALAAGIAFAVVLSHPF